MDGTALAAQAQQWIREQVEASGLPGVVLGLSGGIDSAVVAGLCARALGPANVLGVIMPISSQPQDAADAHAVADTYGMEALEVNLQPAFDALMANLPDGNALAVANLKPRLRMLTLYHRANTLGRLVIGTGNRSEYMTGYFTKYGDAGVDLLPLVGMYKHQVRDVAHAIGVPQIILDRAPSAGLWAGQTDEEEMGVTYADLDRILAAHTAGEELDPSPAVERVMYLMRVSEHKRRGVPMFTPNVD